MGALQQERIDPQRIYLMGGSNGGMMPYGTSGNVARVSSPDGGMVQSFEDTQDRFFERFQSAYGNATLTLNQAVGVFTDEDLFEFNNGQILFRILTVDGGAHEVGGGRNDFAIEGQYWNFLSSFERVNGMVQRGEGTVS